MPALPAVLQGVVDFTCVLPNNTVMLREFLRPRLWGGCQYLPLLNTFGKMIIPSLEAPEKRFPSFAAKAPSELSPFPFPLLDLESRQRHSRDILPIGLRQRNQSAWAASTIQSCSLEVVLTSISSPFINCVITDSISRTASMKSSYLLLSRS